METESPQDAVKSAFFERLSHPVMGVFLLALVACNWRSIVCVVVSDANAEYRITQATEYATRWTLFGIPALATLAYVLLSPIFKVLAMMWDRTITNWENVRAYQAKINVVARNTASAEAKLAEVENEIIRRETEKENLTKELTTIQGEVGRLQNGMHDLSLFITPGWQARFPNVRFPVDAQKDPRNYQAVQAVFDGVERLRRRILVNLPS